MKLLSMLNFVLKQNEILKTYKNHDKTPLFERCVFYAKFLKQPLTLGMFVPCDLDGNVLEEPLHIELYEGDNYDSDCKKYQQAKERIIFKGFKFDFEITEIIGVVNDSYRMWFYKDGNININSKKAKIIEDLIPYNLTLIKNI